MIFVLIGVKTVVLTGVRQWHNFVLIGVKTVVLAGVSGMILS